MESFVNLLNSLGIGVVCTDSQGKVQLWNRCMEEWTGVVADVIYGHSLGGCFPQLKGIAERDSLKHPYLASVSFIPPTVQANHHHSSLPAVVTEFKASARDVRPISFDGTATDETSRVASERDESSQHSSNVLGANLNWHRIWTFQPRQQQLEQAHADFVATVSHELRTPLTSIKGFVDTLLQCQGQLSKPASTSTGLSESENLSALSSKLCKI